MTSTSVLGKYGMNDGDIVRIKNQSNSPKMTIEERFRDGCKVVWFDGDGKMYREYFAYGALIK